MNGNIGPVLFASLCGGFFFLLTLGLGLYLVISNIKSRQKAEASQNWPSVPGTITTAEVKKSISHDDDNNETINYYPYVEFTYQVAGQQFSAKRLSFGAQVAQRSPAPAQSTLQKYPVGGQVAVYYDPQNPSDAVLERQVGGFKTGMIIGVICLVISLCIGCGLLYSWIIRL
ncbi:MAG TPA: DUF3592 domain-containing protein [Anaerolineales bacterium]|nr:DUF3592 domain-containing protein [Anaerolineales bacterium]